MSSLESKMTKACHEVTSVDRMRQLLLSGSEKIKQLRAEIMLLESQVPTELDKLVEQEYRHAEDQRGES